MFSVVAKKENAPMKDSRTVTDAVHYAVTFWGTGHIREQALLILISSL
jgi:hypothetical protein